MPNNVRGKEFGSTSDLGRAAQEYAWIGEIDHLIAELTKGLCFDG